MSGRDGSGTELFRADRRGSLASPHFRAIATRRAPHGARAALPQARLTAALDAPAAPVAPEAPRRTRRPGRTSRSACGDAAREPVARAGKMRLRLAGGRGGASPLAAQAPSPWSQFTR